LLLLLLKLVLGDVKLVLGDVKLVLGGIKLVVGDIKLVTEVLLGTLTVLKLLSDLLLDLFKSLLVLFTLIFDCLPNHVMRRLQVLFELRSRLLLDLLDVCCLLSLALRNDGVDDSHELVERVLDHLVRRLLFLGGEDARHTFVSLLGVKIVVDCADYLFVAALDLVLNLLLELFGCVALLVARCSHLGVLTLELLKFFDPVAKSLPLPGQVVDSALPHLC